VYHEECLRINDKKFSFSYISNLRLKYMKIKFHCLNILEWMIRLLVSSVKVKQSHYRPGQALRVPGG
jgi:hypothetical protein